MNNPCNKKFIYVFCNEDKQAMLDLGYKMIHKMQNDGKPSNDSDIYVFVADNSETENFSVLPDITYCFSDTLTF